MTDNDEAILLRRRARRRLVGAIALVVLAVIVLPIILDKEPKPISQDIVIQIPSQNSGRFNTKVLPPPEVANAEPLKEAALPPMGNPASVKDGTGANFQESVKPDAAAKTPAVNGAAEAKGEALPKAEFAQKPAATPKNDIAAKGEKSPKNEAAKLSAPEPDSSVKQPAKSVVAPSKVEADSTRAQAEGQSESFVLPLGAFLNQANVRSLQAKVTLAGFKSYSEIQKVAKGEQIRVRAGPFPSREAAERAREQLQSTGLTVGPVTKL